MAIADQKVLMPSAVIDMVRNFGIDAESLLSELKVDFHGPGPVELTGDQVVEFLSRLKVLMRTDYPAIALGAFTPGVVGYAALNSLSVRDGMQVLTTYGRLELLSAGRVLVSEGPERTRIRFEFSSKNPQFNRFIVELAFSALAFIAKNMLEQSVSPREVTFSFSPATDSDIHARHFKCPVFFDRMHSEFVVDSSVFNLKIRDPDLPLGRLMREMCERRLKESPPRDPFTRLAEEGIEALFDGAPPSMEQVATRMNTPVRTLRRKLADEGTSYRDICDAFRRKMACHFLSETDLSVEKIATAVGFSDARGFYTAFKKWTGKSPGAFRQVNP
jgi:AraC-like DNA-binding protein